VFFPHETAVAKTPGRLLERELPASINQTPIKWHHNGKDLEVFLLTGIMSISYDRDNNEVRPELGWCVARKKDPSRDFKKSSSFKVSNRSQEHYENFVE